MELREIARPYMEKISHECNKTVNLAVLDRNEMVYVERISVRSIRRYNISIGTRITPWKSAIGKAVLAYLEPGNVAEMIRNAKKKGTFTLDDAAFAKTLAETRKNGFAVDNQETRKGIMAIAVPIFSAEGVSGAINLIAEPEEISFTVLKKNYAPALIEAGNQLSKALGYQE
jgi:DNA-binding IclR family transcriptional regulator